MIFAGYELGGDEDTIDPYIITAMNVWRDGMVRLFIQNNRSTRGLDVPQNRTCGNVANLDHWEKGQQLYR